MWTLHFAHHNNANDRQLHKIPPSALRASPSQSIQLDCRCLPPSSSLSLPLFALHTTMTTADAKHARAKAACSRRASQSHQGVQLCCMVTIFAFAYARPQQNVQKGYVLKLAATLNLLSLSLLLVGSLAVLSLFHMHVHFFHNLWCLTRCRTFVVQ